MTLPIDPPGDASAASGTTRRALLGLVALAAIPFLSPPAGAGEIYTGWLSSAALDGHDPVAYFRESRPVEGARTITYRWKDAEWRFATEANRAAFMADPERYAPQYGGHCSWATARGYRAKGDPKHWRIVDGRLYVNYDGSVHAEWEKDVPGNIANANKAWPRIRAE